VLLIAGGSGVVPFRSMLRHRQQINASAPFRLLYSAKTYLDLIYRHELDEQHEGVAVTYTLTRQQPPGWQGRAGRVDAAMLGDVAWPAGMQPLAYVCGPTAFVETVAETLVGLGYPAQRVKTERFGGTGEK
jgi:ferredoxin-NADP reductase